MYLRGIMFKFVFLLEFIFLAADLLSLLNFLCLPLLLSSSLSVLVEETKLAAASEMVGWKDVASLVEMTRKDPA